MKPLLIILFFSVLSISSNLYACEPPSQTLEDKYNMIVCFAEDGLAIVSLDKKIGYVDEDGNEIIPLEYDATSLSGFTNGVTTVVKDGYEGVIDTDNTIIIPIEYQSLYNEFHNGLIAAKTNDKWGFIDINNNYVIQPIYDKVSNFFDGYAEVSINELNMTIDTKGNQVPDDELVTLKKAQGYMRSGKYDLAFNEFNSIRNNYSAKAHLGYLYYHGLGVEQDSEIAKELSEAASTNQSTTAFYVLGLISKDTYYKHLKISDLRQALEYFEKAARDGSTYAAYELANHYFSTANIQLNNKQSEVDELYKEALYWYMVASNYGHTPSKTRLGQIYLQGLGVPKNYRKAKFWFEKAVEAIQRDEWFEDGKNPIAFTYLPMSYLGDMYKEGLGVDVNIVEAISWYEKSLNNGNIGAYHKLAIIYQINNQKEDSYQYHLQFLEKAYQNKMAFWKDEISISLEKIKLGLNKDIASDSSLRTRTLRIIDQYQQYEEWLNE